ncbi:coiled-coil domain-containing protein SCD2 [Ziziphus jujuba]|uniref:Coiled-coil domain-containing protein SCD2 n=1 Tax=Ziziphus jujuba TaxID=326968 RepID=A0ABM3ZTK8_ZIZJJ|nr:coiled-coil domain-containing protein SCD2 [Ziziphus jujuba]
MDRNRFVRQKSNAGTPNAPASPMMSPLYPNRHARTGSVGMSNPRKAQNAKAAAQRLAHVMANQYDDEDDDEDDLLVDYGSTGGSGIGLAGGRAMRSRSPILSTRTVQEQPSSGITPPVGRSSLGGNYGDQPVSARSTPLGRPSQSSSMVNSVDQPSSAYSVSASRHSQPTNSNVEQQQPSSQHSYFHVSTRPSQVASSVESPTSGRSAISARQTPAANNISNVEQHFPYAYSNISSRTPQVVTSSVEQPTSARSSIMSNTRPSQPNSATIEQPTSARSSIMSNARLSQPNSATIEQPSSARSSMSIRTSQAATSVEQPPSAPRSPLVTRPHLGIRTVPIVPAVVPLSVKPTASAVPNEVNAEIRRDKRLSLDLGSMKVRETAPNPSASALQDELDMLQEENESLLEKLRLAEERFEESEARIRQLEQQVANLGEGTTLDARLLSRQEAALQQREAALRIAFQNHGNRNNDATTEHLHETEFELKSLQIMTQRMILTQEEMEEVVLKRCWLARYWGLCVEHGIQAELAKEKHEYWSSFAPLPVEVVLAAGQKAREQNDNNDLDDRESSPRDVSEFSGDGNIENMLLVEKGLRELASLKVEDAVVLAMARQRRTNTIKSDELKLPAEGQFDAFELTPDESQEVLFKQAWLTYFWRRAKNHGVEPDIADDRLQFWVSHNTKAATSQDAVDVERGLIELKKLSIDTQLWEESRKELDQELRRTQSQSEI